MKYAFTPIGGDHYSHFADIYPYEGDYSTLLKQYREKMNFADHYIVKLYPVTDCEVNLLCDYYISGKLDLDDMVLPEWKKWLLQSIRQRYPIVHFEFVDPKSLFHWDDIPKPKRAEMLSIRADEFDKALEDLKNSHKEKKIDSVRNAFIKDFLKLNDEQFAKFVNILRSHKCTLEELFPNFYQNPEIFCCTACEMMFGQCPDNTNSCVDRMNRWYQKEVTFNVKNVPKIIPHNSGRYPWKGDDENDA